MGADADGLRDGGVVVSDTYRKAQYAEDLSSSSGCPRVMLSGSEVTPMGKGRNTVPSAECGPSHMSPPAASGSQPRAWMTQLNVVRYRPMVRSHAPLLPDALSLGVPIVAYRSGVPKGPAARPCVVSNSVPS